MDHQISQVMQKGAFLPEGETHLFACSISELSRNRHLLLITTLVAGLTKQFTVLLLGHTLAALLYY